MNRAAKDQGVFFGIRKDVPGMHEITVPPMNWTIAYDAPFEIIRATVTGELTADGIKLMEAELLEESSRKDNYRWLCDCRGATMGINISELYDLPMDLRKLGVLSYHMMALVYTDGPLVTPLVTFFDDRCYNVGLNQKAFSDYDLACLWLTGIDWSIISNPSAVAA
jgi:hypothetical protein